MNKKSKTIITLMIGIFILAGGCLNSTATYATESGDFSRSLYSYQQANEGAIDHITFNSIKVVDTDAAWAQSKGLDMPTLSNESNFVGARKNTGVNAGSSNIWEGTEIVAEDGETYFIRLYVHNNSSGGMDTVAENTKVRFYVPYGSATTQTVAGWLRSSNAIPEIYSDTITFKSQNGMPFSLNYVYGSALLENGGFAHGNGVVLPDTITNQGNQTNEAEDEWTLIGYEALDGKVPGCYKYINYVSIMVRVVYDYDFTAETKVRLTGDTEWQDEIDAKIGDKVEFQIQYKNTSDYTQEGVAIKDVLPANLRYVEGTAKLYNVLYPNGATFTEGTLVTAGVKIGSYTAGSNAFIRFTAEVVDDNLADGKNTLYSWGQTGVGSKVLQDDARVNVQNDSRFIRKVTVLSALIFMCIISICILFYKMHHWKHEHNA